MELHEREFFIGRLCLPYSKISVAENVDVFVHPLSVEEYFEAQEVYKQSFKDAIKAGNLHGEDFEESYNYYCQKAEEGEQGKDEEEQRGGRGRRRRNV